MRLLTALLAVVAVAFPGGAAAQELPAFLREHARSPTLRARHIRDGAVRARRDGDVVNEPTDRWQSWVLSVLDADRGGSPPRPRILCEEEIRVALYLERESLATVTLRGAVLTAEPGRRASSPARVPGLYFEPGVPLHVVSEEGGAARVRFSGFMLSAEGFVDARHIGYAYEPHEAEEPRSWNAELPRGATFLETPSGPVLATLEPYPNTVQRHVAQLLGPPEDGHRLVRLRRNDLTLVGWVEVDRIVEVEGRSSGTGFGMGGSGTGGPSDNALSLPAGTLLLDGPAGDVIGRLETPQQLECDAGCDGERPRVIVPTCVGAVRLFAAPPP